ncbi:hypothetical protein E1N52_43580 [Paraburkholderia guartelaensis]|uniref:Uncharacterized protein n=1 Tax=Paraburkholderia guartelaensis TaxID=2546446 RepID=A0A4R5KKI1_9BURK|nr:hypothetical protein [Paraburkholderia guartelaensis]TDF95017.1 hypothetical protein E1N52_43580 [Paraburkholderia guartelaensis]
MSTMNPTAKRNTQRPMTCASTVQGQRLPVIDITDPRFALPADSDAITALFASYVADERRRARIPTFVTRLILALVSRRAPLLRSVVSARSGFLDGLGTYLLKLGPDNLPPPFKSHALIVRVIHLAVQQAVAYKQAYAEGKVRHG